jgi:hypothetical protein
MVAVAEADHVAVNRYLPAENLYVTLKFAGVGGGGGAVVSVKPKAASVGFNG